jgi:hypothetical protein
VRSGDRASPPLQTKTPGIGEIPGVFLSLRLEEGRGPILPIPRKSILFSCWWIQNGYAAIYRRVRRITKDMPSAQMKLRQQRDGDKASACAPSGGGASASSSHGVTFWAWLAGDRQHPVSISSASVIRDFYNINIGTQQEPTLSDFWEKRFSEVEGMAAKAFEAVVDDRIWPPRDEDRDAIALWAALQHLRSPAIRNQQQDHMAAIVRTRTAVAGIAHLKKVMTEGLRREVGDAELECEWADLTKPGGPNIELRASAHLRILRDLIEPTAQMFAGCGWMLYRFRRRALLTSDTPATP